MWMYVLLMSIPMDQCVSDLYIVGLLPIERGAWRGGPSMKIAANIALEHINNDTSILPGYRLNIIYNDTSCHAGKGVNNMYRNLYAPPKKIAVFGAGCSFVSEATAQASHFWNLVQMSFGSASPALSDKSRFPRFFRANSPDSEVNPAKIMIFEKFGWEKIGIIYTPYELFTVPTEDLLQRLRDNNMTLLRSEMITKSLIEPILNLKNSDVRIIVSGFYEGTGRKIMCQAFKHGLYGKKVIWFFTGWYEAYWWSTEDSNAGCPVEEIAKVVEGSITVSRVLLNPRNTRTLSGILPSDFQSMYDGIANGKLFGDKFAPLSYDSIWALALALNATINDLEASGSNYSLEDFSYTDDTVGSLIFKNMQSVNFIGTGGQLAFNENGDPIGVYTITQVIGGRNVLLGYYDPSQPPSSQIVWLPDVKPVWGDGKVPRDSSLTVVRHDQLSFPLYICICFLSACGAVLTLCFFVFNIYFRELREVKMSSPRLNNVTLCGCLLLYATPFLENVTGNRVNEFCMAKGFLMALGFSLSFGALFAKTWRVHIVMTNTTTKKKIVKDSQLLLMVGVLVAINMVVLLSWVFIDPMTLASYKLTPEVDDEEDTITQPVVYLCESQNQLYFLATLFALQGILMLLGAFLAWETRKVKLEGLNDAKMIGMSIYNVLVLSLLGVTVSMALKNQINLNYALTSLVVILATTVTQCLIFIPKISAVKNNKVDDVGDMVTVAGRSHTAVGTTMASSVVTAQRLILVEKTLMEKNKEIEELKKELQTYKKGN